MGLPNKFVRFDIQSLVIQETEAFLHHVGCTQGVEALVLWAGTVDEGIARIGQVFVPEQRGYRTPQGHYLVVDPASTARIREACLDLGLLPLVQVHSHPQEAFHSARDDRYPILKRVGCLSIVVPHFARSPMGQLTGCSVNELEPGGHWREWTTTEIRHRLQILRG